MLLRTVDLKVLIHPVHGPVAGIQLFFAAASELLQFMNQIFLAVASNDKVNGRVFLKFLPSDLRVTSHGHYDCVRIHFLRLMQHLPRFPVRNIGYGACIDHIHIRAGFERHNIISGLLQHLLHRLQLVGIYLAPQIMKSRLFSS